MNDLTPDYDIEQVAAALGMSTRWVRARIKEGAEHQRYGHKIRFTPEQVDKLRAQFTKAPVTESITTGRKRRSA
jgi:hypothetical protein